METTIGERIAMVRKSRDYTLEKFGDNNNGRR
nr:MAG TPA_asm: Transcriptional regulator, Transcriptional activator, TPR, HTH [Bacteriophage sp.]